MSRLAAGIASVKKPKQLAAKKNPLGRPNGPGHTVPTRGAMLPIQHQPPPVRSRGPVPSHSCGFVHCSLVKDLTAISSGATHCISPIRLDARAQLEKTVQQNQ